MNILFNINLLVSTLILIVLKYKDFEVQNYNYATINILEIYENVQYRAKRFSLLFILYFYCDIFQYNSKINNKLIKKLKLSVSIITNTIRMY